MGAGRFISGLGIAAALGAAAVHQPVRAACPACDTRVRIDPADIPCVASRLDALIKERGDPFLVALRCRPAAEATRLEPLPPIVPGAAPAARGRAALLTRKSARCLSSKLKAQAGARLPFEVDLTRCR